MKAVSRLFVASSSHEAPYNAGYLLSNLFFVCQVFLLGSFMLLSGCGGGGSSSPNTTTSPSTTDSTQTNTNTVDETPVFEGFKYLSTAKGILPQQQEATLLKIKGITSAKCDGYECNFTFSGREATYVYPVVELDSSQLRVTAATHPSEPILDSLPANKQLVFSRNILSTLSENRLCPNSSQKEALILAPAIGTYGKNIDENATETLQLIKTQLQKLGYNVDMKIGSAANLEAFENISKLRSRYGLIFMAVHSNADGRILTGEPLCDKSNVACQDLFKNNAYGYGGHGDSSVSMMLLPKWWESRGIADENSKSQFYFFNGCRTFASNSVLRKYFRDNNMNGVSVNELSPMPTATQSYVLGIPQNAVSNFYLNVLKKATDPNVSILSAINTLKIDAGKICKSESSFSGIFGVLASECLVSMGNSNLYISPNACNSTVVTPTPPVSTNGAPVVSNFIVPTSAKVNQAFTMNVSYSDPNGNNDVVKVIITADDDYPTLHTYPITSGNGMFSRSVSFDSVGQHWVNVYVVDSVGNNSNEIKQNITITSDSSNTTTAISGTYIGSKIYTDGIEAGTKYSISLQLTDKVTGTYLLKGMSSTIDNGKINGNTISFTTKPYFNRSCQHAFAGFINGNILSGTMATENDCNGSGTWTVTKQ